MILIADTSALLAAFRSDDPDHDQCADFYSSHGGFAYSPLVIAELDHLLQQHIGYQAASGAFEAICARVEAGLDEFAQLDQGSYLAARRIRSQYRDMLIDLADVFVIVLAKQYGTDQIFTLDEGDFRRLRPIGTPFDYFRLLPADK